MRERIKFLGTGASSGVPVIGCDCPVCQSPLEKNKRLRSSLLLKINGKRILIDPGPDLRQQALKYGISHIDGVLITHAHSDHVGGIDDMRILYFRNEGPLPCLLLKNTFEDLKKRFFYIFVEKQKNPHAVPHFDITELKDTKGEVTFLDVPFKYFTYYQEDMQVMGFRHNKLAYVPDIKHYDESLFDELHGLDTLIISGLRQEPSPVHLTIEESVAFAEKVNPKQLFITHISHDLNHNKEREILPDHASFAYDDLEVEFERG